MIKRKPKKAWSFSKKKRVDLLNLIVALCTLLIASRQALGISDTIMGVITVTGGMAIAFLKLAGNQAVDEALNTPSPAVAEHIAALQDALGHAQEWIDSGVLPTPPDGETLPAGRVGSQEPQG
jgi:hypothetical protein